MKHFPLNPYVVDIITINKNYAHQEKNEFIKPRFSV